MTQPPPTTATALAAATEAIRLAEKATPGPHVQEGSYISAMVPTGRPNGEVIARCNPSVYRLEPILPNEANAALYAHAGTHYREIASAYLASQRRVEELREALRDARATLQASILAHTDTGNGYDMCPLCSPDAMIDAVCECIAGDHNQRIAMTQAKIDAALRGGERDGE